MSRLCLTFLCDGLTFSSGFDPPNFRPGGAVGFLIESKTGRSSLLLFRLWPIIQNYIKRTEIFSNMKVSNPIDIASKKIQYESAGAFNFRTLKMGIGPNRARRPFWLPAANYYVLAVAMVAAVFFVLWGALTEVSVDMPWVIAGVIASMLLAGAVILRETVLRRQYNRFLRAQREAGRGPIGRTSTLRESRASGKLSLEQNEAILAEIRQKSDAAKVLSKFSAGHREVFEICSEYISRNERELSRVNAGSPRLAPLLKSRARIADLQRFHLLQWAEIEARTLAAEAGNRTDPAEQIEAAQSALGVIESALATYPAEPSLIESRELLQDLVVSVRVSRWVEEAERAVFKGEFARGKSLYRDALFDLGRDNLRSRARDEAAAKLNAEIGRLEEMENRLADFGN